MTNYTYRELQKILGLPLVAVQRYTLYALGVDIKSPKGGGVKRSVSLDGAIKIYVISRLIGKIRMELCKAKEIIREIKTDEAIWSIKLEEGIYINFVIEQIRELFKK